MIIRRYNIFTFLPGRRYEPRTFSISMQLSHTLPLSPSASTKSRDSLNVKNNEFGLT